MFDIRVGLVHSSSESPCRMELRDISMSKSVDFGRTRYNSSLHFLIELIDGKRGTRIQSNFVHDHDGRQVNGVSGTPRISAFFLHIPPQGPGLS